MYFDGIQNTNKTHGIENALLQAVSFSYKIRHQVFRVIP